MSGAMSHPNGAAEMDPDWNSGILVLNPLCMKACICPCVVYGKTQYRLDQVDQQKEATDLSGYQTFNGNCGLMALLCGSQAILAMLQRTRIRKLYEINGSVGKDFAAAFCCLANILAQHENEVVERETRRQQQQKKGVSKEGYVKPAKKMQYAVPA